jgi:hypothetical protein
MLNDARILNSNQNGSIASSSIPIALVPRESNVVLAHLPAVLSQAVSLPSPAAQAVAKEITYRPFISYVRFESSSPFKRVFYPASQAYV